MRRSPGKIDAHADAILDEQADLRARLKTLKGIAHELGLNRSTVQTHLSRRVRRERQKVVSHGTNLAAHSRE